MNINSLPALNSNSGIGSSKKKKTSTVKSIILEHDRNHHKCFNIYITNGKITQIEHIKEKLIRVAYPKDATIIKRYKTRYFYRPKEKIGAIDRKAKESRIGKGWVITKEDVAKKPTKAEIKDFLDSLNDAVIKCDDNKIKNKLSFEAAKVQLLFLKTYDIFEDKKIYEKGCEK
ncbi:MAG: hypothetical protein ABIH00_03620 [Armatimonadota bacterium]